MINILTVCNQPEADEKRRVFLQVPGKKFLSIEPMLGPIDVTDYLPFEGRVFDSYHCEWGPYFKRQGVDAVILSGETGPGARPMHPDWVRSVRDQCAAAGVPFFFKGWGEWAPLEHHGDFCHKPDFSNAGFFRGGKFFNGVTSQNTAHMVRVGRTQAGRTLDGRTHDELPWMSAKAKGIRFRCIFCGQEYATVEESNACEDSHANS